MDLLSMLMGSMTSQDSLNSLNQKTGASSDQLSKLVMAALPMLLKAMQSNASSQAGATSLANALGQHTSQSSVASQIANADTVDGGKIIAHLLGANSGNVVNQLATTSGLQSNQVDNVLASLAPALMSSVSAVAKPAQQVQQQSGAVDLTSLMGLLGGLGTQAAPQEQPQQDAGSGILGSILGMLTK